MREILQINSIIECRNVFFEDMDVRFVHGGRVVRELLLDATLHCQRYVGIMGIPGIAHTHYTCKERECEKGKVSYGWPARKLNGIFAQINVILK